MNLRAKLIGLLALALAAVVVLPAVAAQGSPIDDKRRQAQSIQAQIAADNDRIVRLGEQYDGAVYRLRQAQGAIAEAERRTADAQAAMDRIKSLLSRRAVAIYMGAGSTNPLDAVNVGNVADLAVRSTYASAAADHDDQLFAQLQKARENLAVERGQLQAQKASAQADKDTAAKAKADAQAANDQQHQLLSQVNGEIAQLVRDEQARRQREEQARAQAALARAQTARAVAVGAGAGRSGGGQVSFPNAPAPNGRAAIAVAYAKAQVGKPYVFATAGPDTFDCSGLTAAAWAQAGVSLAHYSGAQWNEVVHIGAGDLQPGDLVFYGPGGADHVEIYIGGGMVVSASNPADGVKVAPVRLGSASGFGRPGA